MVAIRVLVPSFESDGDSAHPVGISMLMTIMVNEARLTTVKQAQGFWIEESGTASGPVLEILIVVPEERSEVLVEKIHQFMKEELNQSIVYMEVDGKPSIS